MIEPIANEDLIEPMHDLRRLAQQLVKDGHRADDLVQSAMVTALEKPPRLRSTLRAWLARVVTNLARQDARSAGRRERREAEASLPEALASTGDLVERHDIRMQLMQAVRALEEPYREAILLRYLEDLAPRHIAARLGVPVKTIDSRIQRGLQMLRARLDSEHHGDRRAWLVALAPLARSAEVATTATVLGAVLVKGMLSAIALVAVVATTLFFVYPADSKPTVAQPEVAKAPAQDQPAVERTVDAPTRTLAPSSTQTEPTPAPASARATIAGNVLDVAGKPIGGIALRASVETGSTKPVEFVADANGRFLLEQVGAAQDVTSIDPHYAAVLDAKIPDADTPDANRREYVVIVAHMTTIDGIAVDPDGQPVAGARVELRVPKTLRARFPYDLSANSERSRGVRTGADGRFTFADAPEFEGVTCEASHVGYTSAEVMFDRFPQSNVRLVLERPHENLALEGIVFGRDGTPLADARVALGDMPATTNAEGHFTFEYPADAAPPRIMAVAPGLLPVVLDRPDAGWPKFLELHLKDDPLVIAGMVYGPDGKPCAGAEIWVDEPTVFGSWNGNFWVAENIISDDTSLQKKTTSAADGTFRLDGLIDREYGMRAMIPKLAWQIDAGVHRAGDDSVEIRFPSDGIHRHLSGIVVDTAGTPVAAATVRVVTLTKAAADPVSHQSYFNMTAGSSTTTDAKGSFDLVDVPMGSTLDIYGDGLVFDPQWPVPETIDGPITLHVARYCAFRVELASAPAHGTSFKFEDGVGAGVSITRMTPGRIEGLDIAPLVDGSSEVLTATDRARELVILDDEAKECGRVHVVLIPGQTTVIR